MNADEVVSGMILELRRGTLILLVLGQMGKPTYGYSLVKQLNDCQIPMDANTLYPCCAGWRDRGCWKVNGIPPRGNHENTTR